jgi:hypothetical protein
VADDAAGTDVSAGGVVTCDAIDVASSGDALASDESEVGGSGCANVVAIIVESDVF